MSLSDSQAPLPSHIEVAVIGGGPAGLMAAEVLSRAGHEVHLFDAMPSVGRKFLLAGKGGMNLTHAEPLPDFISRYAKASAVLQPLLETCGPQQVREWVTGLGIETFIGSSQRVFPTDMKAAPLLRAWLHRLRHPGGGGAPVTFHMRQRWQGWSEDGTGGLRFQGPQGEQSVGARATVLAMGGASWSRLGSNGAWLPTLQADGWSTAGLRPSNCGFEVRGSGLYGDAPGWSTHFSERFAGQPFKSVALHFTDSLGQRFERKGEFVATAVGLEGSLVYAASALLREEIQRNGQATLFLDLLPDRSPAFVAEQCAHPRGSRSLSSHLKSRLGLEGVKMGLLHELVDKASFQKPAVLAALIKASPVTLVRTRPIDEAISTAGGVAFEGLDERLMSTQRPGVFCAGEMLDWEGPTGGYLLTACLATGRRAGEGAARYLAR
ncbi:NAD(FAD)-utilizing dehydrogenase [Hydrogenophaga crassostreae]|uniref:NAD(FAD)-utilizing dehydrogenase n=1 Tax=Hydrogenophaga crassostreae TaxID=1763535 RepID=A0A163CFN4_9BURK|nr:TIGR03862 family flavoprotein [Hydrogenophaga crassostreae]AOW13584.1 NAD(FAD)-utilizing dehydrogenase [Hydrogenophaga crassostreae]OAD41878.1 NAD(FAD)-utilizing dehydrogenase [Hydrogenophaga crassostreae]